jgi:2-methylcitrate dehydratase
VPTKIETLASFVADTRWDDVPEAARARLVIHLLDTLGVALGALDVGPMRALREEVHRAGGAGNCTLIGGGKTAPDRAAWLNTGLTRYLDYMDGFAVPDEACHPSDNVGAVLAATEHAGGSGRDFLLALALAYEVQGRLIEAGPITHAGFDHTTQLAISIAAGVSKALGLDASRTAHAMAICGVSHNTLRALRTGELSEWKGLAASDTAAGCVGMAMLAGRGITGPLAFFEGEYGYEQALVGHRIDVRWRLGRHDVMSRVFLKRYNAEIHAQSAIEGLLELRADPGFRGDDVVGIRADVFRQAYNLIGGGTSGDRHEVKTKEQADHSLPYLLAVAALDGQVEPEQFTAERVAADDVQTLLKSVEIHRKGSYTRQYPKRWPVRITVRLRDGTVLRRDKRDWNGFHTRPWDFDRAAVKFDRVAARAAASPLRAAIEDVVRDLENRPIAELTALLAQARALPHGTASP